MNCGMKPDLVKTQTHTWEEHGNSILEDLGLYQC